MIETSVHRETPNREAPSARQKENLHGQAPELKSHEMGVQIPGGVHFNVSQKDAVQGTAAVSETGVPTVGPA